MVFQHSLTFPTPGRGTLDISNSVADVVSSSKIQQGLCHVFIQHTSASLILCENADPQVQADLEAFMTRLVPDGDPIYQHTMEGEDDMSAHVRMTLTQTAISLPISQNKLALGTWQAIYLWEHRTSSYQRRVIITVMGE